MNIRQKEKEIIIKIKNKYNFFLKKNCFNKVENEMYRIFEKWGTKIEKK